ncbi:hypothetical protein RIF29_16540 [Crotalaria pallida]|uniref:Uncharacterized protein n=1 Tax=Crotalaria pallida TaxID=3830 RepID=A0AAN9IEK1_CROPI
MNQPASCLAMGAGHINHNKALHSGLVYNEKIADPIERMIAICKKSQATSEQFQRELAQLKKKIVAREKNSSVEADQIGDMKDAESDTVVQMEQCRKPIIVALPCDIWVAAKGAKFMDTHARFGIFPSWESLPHVQASVDLIENSDVNQIVVPDKRSWINLFAYMGPGFLVSITYIDPGNFETVLQSGAKCKYELLWIILLASCATLVIQTMAANLGVVTGKHLAEHCRAEYSRVTNLFLWIIGEVVIVAYMQNLMLIKEVLNGLFVPQLNGKESTGLAISLLGAMVMLCIHFLMDFPASDNSERCGPHFLLFLIHNSALSCLTSKISRKAVVQNTLYASRLLINPDVPEVVDIKRRMVSLSCLHLSMKLSIMVIGDILRVSVTRLSSQIMVFTIVLHAVDMFSMLFQGADNAPLDGIPVACSAPIVDLSLDGENFSEDSNRFASSVVDPYLPHSNDGSVMVNSAQDSDGFTTPVMNKRKSEYSLGEVSYNSATGKKKSSKLSKK